MLFRSCSINQIGTSNAQAGETSKATLPEPASLARRHRDDYADAVQRTAQAPARIAAEMQRIRSGEVLHYDFLQYEHIEMLRHARALSFPPAGISAQQREEMLSQARLWQESAQHYELTIADFLRDHAVASAARSNYLDLLIVLSKQADEKTRSLLARAEGSLLDYNAAPAEDTRLELQAATAALTGRGLNAQRLAELDRQLLLLLGRD